ncbi:unnamed protein product [Fraxinus pennsylvanica]|uniref:Uncharacterized protein n=1 Tax=Fraxinus pennsylvanica TaxID=56036 RepID=A0AAD2E4F5_9LAMI|nr:unnamed protein product [Fraxinus pennsylvanica]
MGYFLWNFLYLLPPPSIFCSKFLNFSYEVRKRLTNPFEESGDVFGTEAFAISKMYLHTHGNILDGRPFAPKTFHVSTPRKGYFKNCKVYQFSAQNACKLIAPHLRIPNVMPQQNTFKRCRCMSALVNADSPITSDWIPVVDQVFRLVSIALTYMAGVIPAENFPYSTQTRISEDNEVPENSSFSVPW